MAIRYGKENRNGSDIIEKILENLLLREEVMSMNLYLVQHAEAKQKDESAERLLTEEGQADIRKVAAFIVKQTNIHVNSIMHSGKTRAGQTAEILSEHLNPSDGIKEAVELEPLADPSTWADRLSEEKEDIMLVGHLPHLRKLSALLLCQDESKTIVNFQTGGIVCLLRDEAGNWSVRWMVIPEILN